LLDYIKFLENKLELSITIVSIGPGRNELVVRK